MSLFPMNREIRRAAKCRCYGCEDCNWRENLYAGSHRPLQTLVEKEEEIAMPAFKGSAGEALNRQIEKDKLKAKMLFHTALTLFDAVKPTMTQERAELLAQHVKCVADLSNEQKIKAAYPYHEIIVEMGDGTLFTIDTDAAGSTVVAHGIHTAESFLRYHGWDDVDIKGSPDGDKALEDYRVSDLFLPGAKAIYAIEA